jgi:hypothetical protein
MKIENYVIGYKIYSLFIAIFDFMHINSMYTLTNVVCCEKLNPTNLGLALSHLFGSHSTLLSLESKGGFLQKLTLWIESKEFIWSHNMASFPRKSAIIKNIC